MTWILQVVGEPTYRVWKLFLSGSANGFAEGALNVYQALLLKPDEGRSGLPLTRAYLISAGTRRLKQMTDDK